MQAPTLPPGIESMPPWVQAILTVLVLVTSIFITFKSIWKPGDATKSKDVVVPGVSVMDGQIFKEATQTIKDSMRQQELRDAQVRELQRELAIQSDIMRDCRASLQAICEHLESIDHRLKRELKRQAEAEGRI